MQRRRISAFVVAAILMAPPLPTGFCGSLFCFDAAPPHTATGWQLRGTVSYDGRQTGDIHIIPAHCPSGLADSPVGTCPLPGPYSMALLPQQQTCWVWAYRDSNANASNDLWEACGNYPLNPLHLSGSAANIDIALLDPDNDMDGLFDWWEQQHFGEMSQTADMDSDGDNLSNAAEYAAALSPGQADSDGDGIPDGSDSQPSTAADCDGDGLPDDWEIFWFGHLDMTGTDNGDGDALDNSAELAAGTDPTRPDMNALTTDVHLAIYSLL